MRVVGVQYGAWGREKYGVSPMKADSMEARNPNPMHSALPPGRLYEVVLRLLSRQNPTLHVPWRPASPSWLHGAQSARDGMMR